MMEAEEARPLELYIDILDFFKNECHLEEETIFGKLRAATDDVDGRLTKMWDLPEPETDTSSSEFDLDSSASDEFDLDLSATDEFNLDSLASVEGAEGKTNNLIVAEHVMAAAQTQNVMKGQLLQKISKQRNCHLMKSRANNVATVEASGLLTDNVAVKNTEDSKLQSHSQNHDNDSACNESKSSAIVSQASSKDNTVATTSVPKSEQESGTKQNGESANTPIAAGEEEHQSLYLQQFEKHMEHRKQTIFLNRFEHEGKECMVQTIVLKGGRNFLLKDTFSIQDIKPLSDSEKLENNFMIHNQCAHGELDTVAHLIDNRGVDPNVLDEVRVHPIATHESLFKYYLPMPFRLVSYRHGVVINY